ncbi:type I restriction enzyme M protein [Algoriphagus locisalis]|uniref:site-specific DNA-methyltransferase (adenine-specific) n=1 Tax=Algoriphagus locisalis TaxID=305507 RepID=A0A1I7E526_9BACT|nr:N-6 DNA methylase [Algoriphagus locisalis]SFU19015.1 type I restriction enzyme M protein [Algoriphagus locisalis]
MLTTEIRNKVQSLWSRLWSGGFSNPISAIEQISYLLFMKRLENFHADTPQEYKWSHYHKIKGNDLIPHIKGKVFPYIKTQLAREGDPFADAMEDASFRINDPTLLEDAIKSIDDIYTEIERQEAEDNQHFQDIQGDVYEHLLKQTSEAGKNGQFRTPRHIIQMMAEMLDPDLDGKICDLACGSGGFLVGAYQYIITKYSSQKEEDVNGLPKGIDGDLLTEEQKNKLKQNTFYGFDIDQTMVRIATMNLMMHGITRPDITHLDTLSDRYEQYEVDRYVEIWKKENENEPVLEIDDEKRLEISAEKYRYILANPPFTGKINSLTISENLNRAYQPKYKDEERVSQTVQSELLFLERIIFMLEEGGKAAVIVPEGLLYNSGSAHKTVRQVLMTDCDLEGVVSLPEGVFMPYTGVKTSILLFKKGQWRNNQPQETKVWFYNMKSDGYSLDANRRRLKDQPLPEAIKGWKDRDDEDQSDRKLQHFAIPYEEIAQNGFELNFNLYQDFIYEPNGYREPKEILEQLNSLETEILKGLEEIRAYEF